MPLRLLALVQSVVYAHPSERYLKIIREGAAHSGLADDFKQHLATLRPYRCAGCGVHFMTMQASSHTPVAVSNTFTLASLHRVI